MADEPPRWTVDRARQAAFPSSWFTDLERPWSPLDGIVPRRGMAWNPAEDRDLLRRLHELDGHPERIGILAREHGRTGCSIATRIAALKAGIRLAQSA